MNIKKYQAVFEVLFVSVILYAAHKLFFVIKESHAESLSFYYPLEIIYAFFACSALGIIFILIKVKEKNIDNVGYTFLALTCFKMLLSYVILAPILNASKPNAAFEKINFFVVFALFLAIETVATIRLLNKNQ
jgi:hypothetical protein